MSVPTNAAAYRGLATAEFANEVPSSPYTLLTPYLLGISARSVAHLMRPVCSNSASAASGFSMNGRSAPWYMTKLILGQSLAALPRSLTVAYSHAPGHDV